MIHVDTIGRVHLEHGDACGLTVDQTWRIFDQSSRGDLLGLLADIATWHPEVFEEALLDRHRVRERVKAKRAAMASEPPPRRGAQ